MKTRIAFFLTTLLALLMVPAAASAQEITSPPVPPDCMEGPCIDFLIPIEYLQIRSQRVTVTIEEQVARTHVEQVFYNPNDWVIEGTYFFPLPKDAVISDFVLWIDGQPVQGEVLDANQARETYEAIVRQMIDPALLEFVDRGAVRARIFPIPPGGERKIELEYVQALPADKGLVRYIYPMSMEKLSPYPIEQLSIRVDVRSNIPLRAVYSPSHNVDLVWEDNFHVTAGYEGSNIQPEGDFALYFSQGEGEAFHLLSYIDPSDPVDPHGFFMLLLAPRPDAQVGSIPKDVLIVMDRSGSMEGEKFQQAQGAATFILEHLNPADRFNVLTFSTGMDLFSERLQPAGEADRAVRWVEQQVALGGTDINRALLEAAVMADNERPTYLIFLTDGLPTEGVTDSQRILDQLEDVARRNLRLFAFGVGYDVDTFLLDSLAEAHHGTSTYVGPGERLDETISRFFEKISTPVMTDLTLDFGDLAVFDLYPSPLPDLFVGSQIVVVGRYREGGRTNVELTGLIEGRRDTFRFPEQAFASASQSDSQTLAALPRLWATRKIGHLLNQIRLRGSDQETIDQIVRLSIRYGIVTPYTSYLVTEDMPLGEAAQQRIIQLEAETMEAAPAEPTFGQDAVEKAAEQGNLADAEVPAAVGGIGAGAVRIIGAHTFVSSSGVWIDTAFDPDTMETVKVPFLSDDYFELAQARPDLAAAFALGQQVIALSDGLAYEVVAVDGAGDPIVIPPVDANATPELITGVDVEPILDPTPANLDPDVVEPPTPPTATPCLGGLLPLALLPAAVLLRRRR